MKADEAFDAFLIYDGWGNLASGSAGADAYLWVGRLGYRRDGDLYHLRARMYDPREGRFLSPDPIIPAGSFETLWQYVLNSPLRYADPTGLLAPPGGDTDKLDKLKRCLDRCAKLAKLFGWDEARRRLCEELCWLEYDPGPGPFPPGTECPKETCRFERQDKVYCLRPATAICFWEGEGESRICVELVCPPLVKDSWQAPHCTCDGHWPDVMEWGGPPSPPAREVHVQVTPHGGQVVVIWRFRSR
jgi:RHS repeat-associated protein